MKKQFLILSATGLAILGAAFAFGASGSRFGWCGGHPGAYTPVHWGNQHDGQYRVDLIAEVLDLDETQKEKLQGVHESMKEARQALSQVRLQTINEVLDLISSETLDQTRVQHIVDRHQALVDEFAPKVTAKIADFHALLTPEQKAKAAEFVNKWKERMEHWQEHHA